MFCLKKMRIIYIIQIIANSLIFLKAVFRLFQQALSRKGTDELWRRGVLVNQFQFQQGEVSVRSIFRHIKLNDITREIEEDWFVVIPQIRVCR